jgi:hypothetical protein
MPRAPAPILNPAFAEAEGIAPNEAEGDLQA